MGRSSNGNSEAGFAKLHGEDFEYYMQTYSILLGRNSKKSTVDVDLSRLGGGMNISRHHARIFYDFERQCFSLEVLGKNGCLVNGVLHLPGNQPVKLVSQDLVQIGDMEFYFLLPVRSILGEQLGQRNLVPGIGAAKPYYNHHEGADGGRAAGKKGRGRTYDEVFEDMEEIGGGSRWKKLRRDGYMVMVARRVHAEDWVKKKADGRSRIDSDSDNYQLLKLAEKDVVSCVATLLSDLCEPGQWKPMEKLHAKLADKYENIWHHSRVRKYLTVE